MVLVNIVVMLASASWHAADSILDTNLVLEFSALAVEHERYKLQVEVLNALNMLEDDEAGSGDGVG